MSPCWWFYFGIILQKNKMLQFKTSCQMLMQTYQDVHFLIRQPSVFKMLPFMSVVCLFKYYHKKTYWICTINIQVKQLCQSCVQHPPDRDVFNCSNQTAVWINVIWVCMFRSPSSRPPASLSVHIWSVDPIRHFTEMLQIASHFMYLDAKYFSHYKELLQTRCHHFTEEITWIGPWSRKCTWPESGAGIAEG